MAISRYLTATMLGLWAISASASDISGRIWVSDGNVAAAGATVSVNCAGASASSNPTGANGRYTISGAGTGTCWITVNYDGKQSLKTKLIVSSDDTAADLELRNLGGNWSVRVQ